METTTVCPFCVALEDGLSPCWRGLFGRRPEEAPGDVVASGSSWSVLIDTAPVVEGHLLMVTNAHLPSLAASSPSTRDELWQMKAAVTTLLETEYRRPSILEHGAASFARNAGACVDHAHLHFIPADLELLPGLIRDYPGLTRFGSHAEALYEFTGKPYLYFEDTAGRSFGAVADRCATQYLRRLSCASAKVPERWNWRDCIRVADRSNLRAEVLATAARVRSWRLPLG